MTAQTASVTRRIERFLRIAAWTIAALMLIVPFVAMQFTREVNWTVGDFVFLALILLAVLLPRELAAKKTESLAYRLGVDFGLGTIFFLIVANGAVGLIGSEREDANMMYLVVILLALAAAAIGRFSPRGLALAATLGALGQVAVPVIALGGGVGITEEIRVPEVVAVTVVFLAGWLLSASLFWHASREEAARAVP